MNLYTQAGDINNALEVLDDAVAYAKKNQVSWAPITFCSLSMSRKNWTQWNDLEKRQVIDLETS